MSTIRKLNTLDILTRQFTYEISEASLFFLWGKFWADYCTKVTDKWSAPSSPATWIIGNFIQIRLRGGLGSKLTKAFKNRDVVYLSIRIEFDVYIAYLKHPNSQPLLNWFCSVKPGGLHVFIYVIKLI